MRYIFLDIDGVLNDKPKAVSDWPESSLYKENILHLNRLIKVSGAEIVLSSTWRELIDLDHLNSALQIKGYTGPDISLCTPIFTEDFLRKNEIEFWLSRNYYSNFVVLDDHIDAEIKGHFVLVNSKTGLTSENVDKAIAILDRV